MVAGIIRPCIEIKEEKNSAIDEDVMQSEEDDNNPHDEDDDGEEEMPEAIGIKEESGDEDDGNGDIDEESDEENDEDERIEGEHVESEDAGLKRVYLPNQTNDGPLECDESAYVFYHEVKTGDPCLSFHIIEDNLGENRADKFPLTMTVVGGTQAERSHRNRLIVMKFSNVKPSKGNSGKEERGDVEKRDSSDDEEDEDEKPVLDCAEIHHPGCVNRIKVTNLNDKPIAASWSEVGSVILWDLSHPMRAVNDHHVMTSYIRNNEAPKPLFAFEGHRIEGYALAWSPLSPGVLASGDCKKFIHLWKPLEGGTWHVDQRAFKGHTASVEDIQWSPNEINVMASCSVDKSIKIWDIRAPPNNACMLTKENAHESDVNVIHWNKFDPLILSGGDDGHIKVWDLRSFPNRAAVCSFKHHVAPITSVEWHPTDRSSFGASGADDQLTIWDLAVERDAEQEAQVDVSADVTNLPPQLLFIHQGQKEIKELHWHQQMPGVVISTAMSGFNVFRTISI